MIKRALRDLSMVVCSLALLAGCASTKANKLTAQERSVLKKLIFIAAKTETHAHRPYLEVREDFNGKTVSLLGSGGEQMSLSVYKARTASAIKVVRDCLSTTYENKPYASDLFKPVMSELISETNPLHITLVSDGEQQQFLRLSRKGKAEFIRSHNADAALIVTAYHKAGLDTKIFGFGSFGVGYTGIYAEIDDYQSNEGVYHSGITFTKSTPEGDKEFCKEFIGNFEHTVDVYLPKWYKNIAGGK